MNLDIEKAYDLYSKITCDRYRYDDDISEYNKIVSIMDRLISSAEALNEIKIEPSVSNKIYNFVLWVNYADLLLASFEKIAGFYGYTLVQQGNIFFSYHNLSDKNDNDYFRFIRAIILPHALDLGDKKQVKFTQGKKAYCPSVCYGSSLSVTIKYLIDDINDHEHYITLDVQDFYDYVEDLYNNNIENIQTQVKRTKNNKKKKSISKAVNESYLKNQNIKDKANQLANLVKKYGTLEDKKERSALMLALKTANDIIDFQFDKVNNEMVEKYKKFLDDALDDLFDYICNKKVDYESLYQLTNPHFDYNEKYEEFSDCGYEITKIACEYRGFGTYIENCYFREWKEKLTKHLTKYIRISSDISMKEFCLMTIICFALYKKDRKN